jgi:hypothetical protein
LEAFLAKASRAESHGGNTTAGLKAEQFAGALAHVIKLETEANTGKETVLGQAWLVSANKLVTAGHVVDAAVNEGNGENPSQLFVVFPNSGNKYAIKEIKLHPSFVRQPDQLVNFDLALLTVDLHGDEALARPLPVIYEKNLAPQTPLSAIRYPVHLGQFSSALNPLAQTGSLLGPLRKHDSFHLLHDLALAPGDSGAPVFDGESVVAIHCGDTATLPGLNLPTTSIRLALWIDALRELGVDAPRHPQARAAVVKSSPLPLVLGFAFTFFLSFGLVTYLLMAGDLEKYKIDKVGIKPVKIEFNAPRKGYQLGQPAVITITPGSDAFVYLYHKLDERNWGRGFPATKTAELNKLTNGRFIAIDRIMEQPLRVDATPQKLRLVAISAHLPPLELAEPSFKRNIDQKGNTIASLIPVDKELDTLRELKQKNPDQILDIEFDGPVADKKLPTWQNDIIR